MSETSNAEDLVVLFADITGSTKLYSVHGDEKAHAMVSASIDLLSHKTTAAGGRVIKTIGDEIMATFPTADQAVDAAIEMQLAHEDNQLSIKVGLHLGPVIEKDDDVYGDAVNVASRMVGLSTRGEIITTRSVVDRLAPDLKANTHQFDTATVKGKDDPIDIYKVIWESDDDATMMEFDPVAASGAETGHRLRLTHQGADHVMDKDEGAFTIGRRNENKIVVPDGQVSRSHATIEYKRGRFILSDHSSRGTYVVSDDGADVVFLKRESTDLRGRGSIYIGRSHDDTAAVPIAFEVVDV